MKIDEKDIIVSESGTEYIKTEIFINKEKTDHIRNMFLNSIMKPQDAIDIIKLSNNYARDVEVSMKLANAGYSFDSIWSIIKALNLD